MKKDNLALTISIIALIISILALLINMGVIKCGLLTSCQSQNKPVAVQQAQPAVPQQQQAEPVQEENVSYEQEVAEPIVVKDQPLKKKGPAPVFVDLGLPSGTKWCNINEPDMATFEVAVEKYGKSLPTQKQYTELYEKCKWLELKDGGYKVVGPNGNFVIFPLTGFINCTGEFRGANEFGDYWTATKGGSGEAYRVVFNSKGVKIVLHTDCYARAIRLVEK